MTGTTRFIRPIIILAAAGALAGCGTTLPSATTSPQVRSAGAPLADTCASDRGVSVKPCSIELSAKKPSASVTTKGPQGGTFTVKDPGCETRGIATISGSGNTYTVTIGTKGGLCVATFVDDNQAGKRIGAAKLIIVYETKKKKHKHKH